MTSDGVDGTAAAWPLRARSPGPMLLLYPIKRDDGRLGQRYIGPRYPHAPAGLTPSSLRCERQVASALRTFRDCVIARPISAAGTAGLGAGKPCPAERR